LPYAKEIIDDFVLKTKTKVVEYIPRSVTVAQCELQGKTTIEAAFDSAQAKVYMSLAEKIAAHTQSKTPAPLGVQELRDWADYWGKYLLSLETGEIRSELAPNI
jgi:nitrogenase iron protein NifH